MNNKSETRRRQKTMAAPTLSAPPPHTRPKITNTKHQHQRHQQHRFFLPQMTSSKQAMLLQSKKYIISLATLFLILLSVYNTHKRLTNIANQEHAISSTQFNNMMAPSATSNLHNKYTRTNDDYSGGSSLAQLSASLSDLERQRQTILNQIDMTLSSHSSPSNTNTNTNNQELIAIVLCIRSKKHWTKPSSTLLHNLLLPSIEQTLTKQERQLYNVQMVICYDANDTFFSSNTQQQQHLQEYQDSTTLPLNFISIPKKEGRPHYIPFNECTRAAYEHGAEYILRINDDTEFTTSSWLTHGISTLQSFSPSNVGVVGPSCELNNRILTHDMVHRTHLDIFGGVYYPEVFDNYWVDDWISKVYPADNTKRIEEWEVEHHVNTYGTRYEITWELEGFLEREVERGQKMVKEWLEGREASAKSVLGSDLVSDVWGPMASKHLLRRRYKESTR